MPADADKLRDAVETFYATRDAPFKHAVKDAALDNGTETETGYESHVIKAGLRLREIINEDVADRHFLSHLEEAIDHIESARKAAEREETTGAANQFRADRDRLREIHAQFA